jgi:F0F1-type ATP synthase membrane subunit a
VAQVQPAAGSTAEAEVLPSRFAPALFYIGPSPEKNVPSIFAGWWPKQIPLPITNSILCTWIVAAIILVIVRATTWKNIKEIPSGMQNLLEAIVEAWDNFMSDVLDARVTRWAGCFRSRRRF